MLAHFVVAVMTPTNPSNRLVCSVGDDDPRLVGIHGESTTANSASPRTRCIPRVTRLSDSSPY